MQSWPGRSCFLAGRAACADRRPPARRPLHVRGFFVPVNFMPSPVSSVPINSENEMPTMSESETPRFRYTAALAGEIEPRWQEYWAANGTFYAPNPAGAL